MKQLGFKVTVEYYCPIMIDDETLKEEYNNIPMLAYQDISDSFQDDAINFATGKGIVVDVKVI